MARIRTIKPEFFTSEDIVSLTPLARILYIALWCEADREGRLSWKPRTLKMKYLPAESGDIFALCDELIDAKLVVPYEVDVEPYAVLPSFKKHQAINVREAQSAIPEPPNDLHVHARAKYTWKVSPETRATVLARDAHACVRCGSQEHLQIDHIFPKSMGGTNALTNLRTLCRSCNAGRPVSGQALIDDLKADGFTLADMQRTCMHVQDNGEGKGKEGKEICAEPQSDSPPPSDEAAPPVVTIPLVDKTEFVVTQPMVDEWAETFPAVDVVAALRRMRTWCIANPAQKKTARGVQSFVVRWLSKEQDSGPRGRLIAQVDREIGAFV